MSSHLPHLAKFLWASTLAGCSLIYNPSNLPEKGQMPIDAPIADADPTLLRLDEIKSGPLLEGAGQGGAPKQILVVFGEHITQDAMITLETTQAGVVMSDITIAEDGNSFAALVVAPYMDTIDEGTMIPVTIKVSQQGTERTIDWQLMALDQITAGGTRDAPVAGKLYSHIDVADAAIVFNQGATKAIMKVVGGINVTGTGMITANALGIQPGAGGCPGGAAGAPGSCFGSGKNPGGGAGFVAPGVAGSGLAGLGGGAAGGMVGDDLILEYGDGSTQAMNRSAGGAGGTNGGGANNGNGGGGGGTIELTAGGHINVTALQAIGGNGTNAALAHGGGGGAGGVVVLRAGGMLTFPTTVTLNGGVGGGGAGQGGAGAAGRWRYDAASTMGTAPAGIRRGPMFVQPPSPIYSGTMRRPTLTLANEGGIEVTLITIRPDGMASESIDQMTVGAMAPVQPPELAIGINKVCVLVPGGSVANDEATNCIELAFVP